MFKAYSFVLVGEKT